MTLKDAEEAIARHEEANRDSIGTLNKGRQIYHLIRDAVRALNKKEPPYLNNLNEGTERKGGVNVCPTTPPPPPPKGQGKLESFHMDLSAFSPGLQEQILLTINKGQELRKLIEDMKDGHSVVR